MKFPGQNYFRICRRISQFGWNC